MDPLVGWEKDAADRYPQGPTDKAACEAVKDSTDPRELVRVAHAHWDRIGWPEDAMPLALLQRAIDLGGWNEYDRIRNERDLAVARAHAAEKFRETIATLIAIYERQRVDEPEEGWPEGELSPRQALLAIAETIGNECSICRRRHGQEVQHAAE